LKQPYDKVLSKWFTAVRSKGELMTGPVIERASLFLMKSKYLTSAHSQMAGSKSLKTVMAIES
jgi:hypothetical protein